MSLCTPLGEKRSRDEGFDFSFDDIGNHAFGLTGGIPVLYDSSMIDEPPLKKIKYTSIDRLSRFLKDKYQVKKFVGGGGYGDVYKAVSVSDKTKKVAIKVFQDEEEFQKELNWLKQIDKKKTFDPKIKEYCPGFIEDFSLERKENSPLYGIVMEYCEGKELMAYSEEYFDISSLSLVGLHLLDFLKTFRSYGIVHCDIKPNNIMYDKDTDTLQIIDYGLAKDVEELSVEPLQLKVYLSLSALLSKEKYDSSIDLWSIGCILFFMCNQEHLFPGVLSEESRILEIIKLCGIPSNDFLEKCDVRYVDDYFTYEDEKDEFRLKDSTIHPSKTFEEKAAKIEMKLQENFLGESSKRRLFAEALALILTYEYDENNIKAAEDKLRQIVALNIEEKVS